MKDLSLGPVCNPDGSPSDVTLAMLAGTGRDADDFARDAAAAALAASTGNGPGSRCTHYHRDDRRCTGRAISRYYCDAHAGGDPCAKCRRTMKVRVSLVVTVDLDDYRMNYGTDDPDTIRDDLRYAIRDAVATGAVLADGIVDADFSGGAK